MKKVLRLRVLCVTLVFVLIMNVFAVTALALNDEENKVVTTETDELVELVESTKEALQIQNYDTTTASTTSPAVNLKAGEKTLEELSLMTVDLSTLPEIIDPKIALEKEHVNRLYLQEKSSNIVIYQNKDGTKTTYLFANPVKYIDTDGKVKDKSSSISQIRDKTYSYAMQYNSVKAYFPKTLSQDTLITYNTYSIGMSPKNTVDTVVSYDDNSKKIVYPYAFGDNTLLVYTTQLDGLKEDIVLAKNIGVSEFDFEMTLTGLEPYEKNGVWYLKDKQGKTVGTIGNIVINDSAGNLTHGSIRISRVNGSGKVTDSVKYDVKVIVPEEFLNSFETVYPVYIDPTVTIYEDGYYTYTDTYGDPVYVDYNAIIDIGLYNTEDDVWQFSEESDKHVIGDTPGGGEGRVVYRLYDFYGEYGQYKNLYDYQIGSAEFHFYPYADYNYFEDGVTTVPIYANPMSIRGADDGEQVVYNDEMFQGYSSDYESSILVDIYSSAVSIDITDIVKGWSRYNRGESTNDYDNPENGFVIRGDTSLRYYLKSLEYSYSNQAYLVLDISYFGGPHYISFVPNNMLLGITGNSITTLDDPDSDNSKWYIDYVGNGDYIIRSFTDVDKCFKATTYSFTVGNIDSNYGTQYLWNIQYSRYGGVVISSKYNGKKLCYADYDGLYMSDTSASVMNSWGLINIDDYIGMTSAKITTFPYIDEGRSVYLNIVCDPIGCCWNMPDDFVWSSSNTAVATVNSEGYVTAHSTGTATICAEHKILGISCRIELKVCTVFKDEQGNVISQFDTLLANNYNFGFLTKSNSTSETPMRMVQTYQGDLDSQQWSFIRTTHGYYIKFKGTNEYACLVECDNGAENRVGFTSSISEATVWNLYKTPYDLYNIVTDCSSDKCCLRIYHFSKSEGKHCVLEEWNEVNKDCFEWHLGLGTINDVEWEAQEEHGMCWVAVARMFAKNYGNIILDQKTVFKMVKKFEPNESENKSDYIVNYGTEPEIQKAIGYFLGEIEDTEIKDFTLKTQHVGSCLDAAALKNYIDNGHVIIAGRKKTYISSNGVTENGHMMVIVGYVQMGNQLLLIIKDSGEERYRPYIFRSYAGFADDSNSSEWESGFVGTQGTTTWQSTIIVDTTS